MDGALLVEAFARNVWIVKAQTEDVTHEDSLIQSPYNINCLNWVVGHIVQSRDVLLGVLDAERVLTPEQFARYERESDPVTGDGPDVVRLGDLVDAMEAQQALVAAILGPMTAEDLAAPRVWGDREVTLLQRIQFQYFHDTYHTGQTDVLRQVSGKSDRVI